MFSHGSMAVRQSQKKMQQVGASARERIIAAAAARWRVPPSECAAAQSVVTHRPSGRTLRYGELAADAAKVKLAKEPAIKTPAQFTFLPRRIPRACRALRCERITFGPSFQSSAPGRQFVRRATQRRSSAADLKFLHHLRQARLGTSNRKRH